MKYLGGNGKIVGGTIKYRGRDMATMSEKELEKLRGSEIAMIYQEPMASLNPSMRKICGQFHWASHSWRNINERSVCKYCRIQSSIIIIRLGHYGSQIFLN